MKKLLVLGLVAVTFCFANLAVSAAGLADVFSAEYYADTYVDHWFAFGINEGREDGTDFDPQLYAERYDDIRAAYGENWEGVIEHYLTWGIPEGRDGGIEKPVAVAPVVSAPVVSAPVVNPPANV